MKKILRIFLRMIAILIGIILITWVIAAQFIFQFRTPDRAARKQFSDNDIKIDFSTYTIEGRNIHYAKTGNDTLPTLFFIHGSPGAWDVFEGYLANKQLLEKFRMISVDRPGFGYSDFGRSENLATQSTMISPLFHQLDNGKSRYLVGHSSGGPLIIKLAADNPGMFSALVVLAGSVDPALEEKESWRVPLMYFPLKYMVPGAMRPSNKELWYLKTDLVKLKEDLPKINIPVYIVHGDKDNMVPVGNADYLKKMLVNSPHVELNILRGANHFIPWMHDEEIKEVLLRLR